jgi:hypothetical protein
MNKPKRKRLASKRKGRTLSEEEKAARASRRAAKLKAAKMRSPEELSKVLGVGLNQTYGALANGDIKGAVRLGQRWLIPERVIERLINGEPLNAS